MNHTDAVYQYSQKILIDPKEHSFFL